MVEHIEQRKQGGESIKALASWIFGGREFCVKEEASLKLGVFEKHQRDCYIQNRVNRRWSSWRESQRHNSGQILYKLINHERHILCCFYIEERRVIGGFQAEQC